MIRRLRCRWPFEPWQCTCCGQLIEGAAPVSVSAGLACEPCVDSGRRGEPFIPLTLRPVKPRSRASVRPILAVCMRENRCVTEEGETFTVEQLPERIRERTPGDMARGRTGRQLRPDRIPPSLVVTDAGMDLIGFLDSSPAAQSPFWQWQCALRNPSAWRPEAKSNRAASILTARPVRFGYASRRDGQVRAKGRAHWYEVLDVPSFCELPKGWGEPDAGELLRFGLDLRDWSNRAQLPVLVSASSYGARLLRDARFGGGWTRKAPAATNRQLRAHLPGNHYQLLTRPGFRHRRVHKLDQHAAHHHAALGIRFPHTDHLTASGWFRRPLPSRKATEGAIEGLSPRWSQLLAQPGLFTLAVHVNERAALDPLNLPQLRKAGTHWRTLTSIEVAHVRQLPGVGLGDIWCCWTSDETDERLNELAYWSLDRIAQATPRTKTWLKPALLAAYGMLAARPRRFRNVWRWTRYPEAAMGFATRFGPVVGFERSSEKESEPQTANVLWRALIESEVRLRSLRFAQQLRGEGFRPIAVYADAVFATGRGEPPAPVPWRYEGTVTDLIFESAGRYRSREEVRLPGIRKVNDGLQVALPTATAERG